MTKKEVQQLKTELNSIFSNKRLNDSGKSKLRQLGFDISTAKRNTHLRLTYHGRSYTASSSISRLSAQKNLVGDIIRDIRFYEGIEG